MKKNFYLGLFLGTLLIISCAARSPLSPKNLSQEDQKKYGQLKKAGAAKAELDIFALHYLTPTLKSVKDSLWREFWNRRYEALTPKEQTVFRVYLSDSLSRIRYLSLKNEKERSKLIKKLLDKKRKELVKTEEGKILYYSMKLLFSEEEMEKFLMSSPPDREEFLRIWWAKKDPDLTTRINEFKEEFDQRVEHAYDFFHGDERGNVYILYGPPDIIEPADYYSDRSGNFVSLDETKDIDQVIEDLKSRSEVWVYYRLGENGTFQFEDRYGYGYYELMPYLENKGLSHDAGMRALSQYITTKTEKIDMAKAEVPVDLGEQLNFALSLWDFRNKWDSDRGDTYAFNVNLGIPLEELTPLSDSDFLNEAIFTEKIVIFDEKSMLPVAQDSTTIRKKLPKDQQKGMFYIDQYRHDSLPPGNYIVGISISDSGSQKKGIFDTTISLASHAFAVGRDKISSLVMAHSIWPADSTYVINNGHKFIRNSMIIVPRPGNVYLKGQLASYYCELYELKRGENDSLKSLVIYNILYQVENDEFALYAGPDSVYASWPANIEGQPFLMGTLNHLEKGDYILHVIVYDRNDPEESKDIRETAVRFKIS